MWCSRNHSNMLICYQWWKQFFFSGFFDEWKEYPMRGRGYSGKRKSKMGKKWREGEMEEIQACNSPLFPLWNLQGVKATCESKNIHFLAELQVTCGPMDYWGTGKFSDIAFISSPTITTAVEEFPCHYSSCLCKFSFTPKCSFSCLLFHCAFIFCNF